MLKTLSLCVGIVSLAASVLAGVVPPAAAPTISPRWSAASLVQALVKRQVGQLPNLPPCVGACIQEASMAAGCDEYNCLCHSAAFINSTAFCLASSCSDAATLYGVQFGQQACLQIGVTESIPAQANSVLATKTTAGTSGAFDTATNAGGATVAATNGAGATGSAPAAPSAPSNSGAERVHQGVTASFMAFLAFGLVMLR